MFAVGKSLHQWLSSVEFGRDAMTSYLSGAAPIAWYNFDHADIPILPTRPENPNPANPNPDYNVTEVHYQLALKNLQRMVWVGLTERFPQSICQLQFLLGYRENFFSIRPANRNVKKMPISEGDRKLIVEYNNYDMMLYNEAQRLFQEQTETLNQRGLPPSCNLVYVSQPLPEGKRDLRERFLSLKDLKSPPPPISHPIYQRLARNIRPIQEPRVIDSEVVAQAYSWGYIVLVCFIVFSTVAICTICSLKFSKPGRTKQLEKI